VIIGGIDVTGAASPATAERIPVQELQRRMKVESEMKLQQGGTGAGITWTTQTTTPAGTSTTVGNSTGPIKQ